MILHQNNLVNLKDAVRYGDLLKEHGEELSEDELILVKKCVLAIRKIESAKYVSSGGSKVALAVVAVIAAIVVILGILCSVLFFGRAKVATVDRGANENIEMMY